jgi:hypothetical protein
VRLPPALEAVREEWNELDAGPATLRAFGWQVGGVLALIGGVVAWRTGGVGPVSGALLGFGGALVLVGLTFAWALRPVYRAWMAVTLAMGFVVSHVLLALVFFGLVTPIGLVMRLFGHDPLGRTPAPPGGTYWKDREPYDPHDPTRLERSF